MIVTRDTGLEAHPNGEGTRVPGGAHPSPDRGGTSLLGFKDVYPSIEP